MFRTTPALPEPSERRSGRTACSLARLLCLALPVALLAGCSRPAPGTAATAASAPGHPPAQAGSVAAAPTPTPAPAAVPNGSAASAPTAAAAEAPPPAADAPAPKPSTALPPAVVAFQKQRDACDHFRGEEPYDKQRAAYLKAQLAKTCKGSDKALAALRQRFAKHPEALAALKDYEDRIE